MMKSKLNLLAFLLLVVSLLSCKSNDLGKKDAVLLNSSALYSPTSVTTIQSLPYQFHEGTWVGTGEKFYSQAAFTRAVTIGREK